MKRGTDKPKQRIAVNTHPTNYQTKDDCPVCGAEGKVDIMCDYCRVRENDWTTYSSSLEEEKKEEKNEPDPKQKRRTARKN